MTVTYATDAAAAEEVVQQIESDGGSAGSAHLDVADAESIRAAVAAAVERFGGLDVLVANAVRWPIDAREP